MSVSRNVKRTVKAAAGVCNAMRANMFWIVLVRKKDRQLKHLVIMERLVFLKQLVVATMGKPSPRLQKLFRQIKSSTTKSAPEQFKMSSCLEHFCQPFNDDLARQISFNFSSKFLSFFLQLGSMSFLVSNDTIY